MAADQKGGLSTLAPPAPSKGLRDLAPADPKSLRSLAPPAPHPWYQQAAHTAISEFGKLGDLASRISHGYSDLATSGLAAVMPKAAGDSLTRSVQTYGDEHTSGQEMAQTVAPINPGEEDTAAGTVGSIAGNVAQAPLTGPAFVPAQMAEAGVDHYDRARKAGLSVGKSMESAIGHAILTGATFWGGGKLADAVEAKVFAPILTRLEVKSGGLLTDVARRGLKGTASASGFATAGEATNLVGKILDAHADPKDLQKLAGTSKGGREALINGATAFVTSVLGGHPAERAEAMPGEAKPADMPQDVQLGQPAKEPLAGTPEVAGETAPQVETPAHPAQAQIDELQANNTRMRALTETRSGMSTDAQVAADKEMLDLHRRQQEVALDMASRVARHQAGNPVEPGPTPTDPDVMRAQRLSDPRMQSELAGLAGEVGIAQEGGHPVNTDSESGTYSDRVAAKGKTQHINTAEWWNDRPSGDTSDESGNDVRALVEKISANPQAKLGGRQKEMLDFMMDKLDRERPPDIESDARPGQPMSRTEAADAIMAKVGGPKLPEPPVAIGDLPDGPNRDYMGLFSKWQSDRWKNHAWFDIEAAQFKDRLFKSFGRNFWERQVSKFAAPGRRPEDLLNAGMKRAIDDGPLLDEAFARNQDRLPSTVIEDLRAVNGANDEQRAIMADIQERSRSMGAQFTDQKLLNEFKDNYMRRLYKKAPGESDAPVGGRPKWSTTSTSTRQRVYPSSLDAAANGKEFAIPGAIESLQQVSKENTDVIGNRNLVNALRKMGVMRFTETDPHEVAEAAETGDEPEKFKQVLDPRFKDWAVVARVDLANADPKVAADQLSAASGVDASEEDVVHIYGKSREIMRKDPTTGAAETVGWAGNDVKILADGTVMVPKPVFVPADLADKINASLATDKYPESRVGTVLRGFDTAQQAIKSTMLKAPIVHYAKVIDDITLAAPKGDVGDYNPAAYYKRGYEAMLGRSRDLELLVRSGLRLAPAGEFVDAIHQQQTFVGRTIDRVAGLSKFSMATRNYLRNTLQDNVDTLFHKVIPAYQTHGALIGLDQARMRGADDLAAGRVSEDELALGQARKMNSMVGNLNYEQLERNPTLQKWANRVFFSTVWSESNIRKAGEAFEAGAVGTANLQMWLPLAARYGAVWAAGNFAAAFMDDQSHPVDRYLKNMKAAYGSSLRAFMGIDVTPELALLGRKDPRRMYFGILGGFRDTADIAGIASSVAGIAGKTVLDKMGITLPKGSPQEGALGVIENKLNVAGRAGQMAVTGQDYRGQTVTSADEAGGYDDKGTYLRSRIGRYLEGQPKGGKLFGQLTSYTSGERPGPIRPEQYGPYAAYQIIHNLPIHFQNAADAINGQIDWFEAGASSLGMQPTLGPKDKPKR